MPYLKRQQEKIDAGLCKDCGNSLCGRVAVLCKSCAQKASDRSSAHKRIKRKEWEANNQCTECGAPRDSNLKKCKRCHERTSQYQKKYYKKLTKQERELRNEKLLTLRRKRIAKGLCPLCGEKSLPTIQLCSKHYFQDVSKSATGTVKNWEFLKQLLELQDFKCKYTGDTIVIPTTSSIDHIIPKSHKDYPGDKCLDNLCWTTKRVNTSKNNFSFIEFVEMCQKVIYTSGAGE